MSFHNTYMRYTSTGTEHRNRIVICEFTTVMAYEAASFHATYTRYTGGGAEYSSGSVLFG